MIGFPIMFGLSYFGAIRLFPDLASQPNLLLLFFFQVMFCGTTVTILSGTIAERTKFEAYVAITILLSALVYPLFGQWVWALSPDGEAVGWLAKLGFVDFAGSTVVHSLGGWAALAMAIIVGSRQGRFDASGEAAEIPSSNLPATILGVLLLWFGWFGFNGGSTFAFNETTLRVLFNTLLGGSVGGLTGFMIGTILRGRADINLILNGVLAGLVAITAGADIFSGAVAALTACVGVLVFFSMAKLLLHFKIDDVVNAIPVHLGAGIWGTLAVGLFGNLALIGSDLNRINLILVQLLGIGVCAIWTYSLVYGVMGLINRIRPLRVSSEDEEIGLNISEHHARTDLVDLLDVMQEQAVSRDFSVRAPVERFTQIGRVANYYNLVMDSLEDAQAALVMTNADLEKQSAEISKANQKLISANEQVKSFANILSHDLRTPITSVRALVSEIQLELTDIEKLIADHPDASSLTKEAAAEFIPESLDMISAAISQMDTLTKQILTVAREESRPYEPKHIQSDDLVRQLVNAQMGIIRERNILVEIGTLPAVISDEVMLQQVFTNLISNAIKYLHPERRGIIVIDGKRHDNQVIFRIHDNGLGIPKSQYDRVFQLFRRVGKHKNIEGNGFGLFYIRTMLQRIDGNIWFESEENVGTTFYVTIPNSIVNNSEEEKELWLQN